MKTALNYPISFALYGLLVYLGTYSVSLRAETETVTTFDYGTGTFSQETIRRDNGRVDVRGYDYGTGSHYQYQGDADGGQGFDYGTGTFTDVQGNPYGVED
jgi:hypothetical protein